MTEVGEKGEEAPFSGVESTIEPRRAHPRYEVELDVSIGSDHNFYAGFVENMSVTGVFIATHALRPVGETLEVTIHLPDSEVCVRGRGEVRWIRDYSEESNVPPGMGVRFLDLDPVSAGAVERFLKQRAPLLFDE